GLLVSAPKPRVFPVSLPTPAKYEGVLRFGPRSPVSPQRIQSSRGRSTPAAARDNGSRESATSTNAHACRRSVASASKEKAKHVRPDEAGPHRSEERRVGK